MDHSFDSVAALEGLSIGESYSLEDSMSILQRLCKLHLSYHYIELINVISVLL